MELIAANWPAPKNITAFTTTRNGGVSKAPYDTFNLAAHADDNVEHVLENRKRLRENFKLPNEPAWLQQTHSNIAVYIDDDFKKCEADASYTDQKNQVCVVMTADCLPILITNKQGTEIAAIHAGWQGLAKGIIEATIKKLKSDPNDLMAWLGPAIGPNVFEVGADVHELFINHDVKAESGFTPFAKDKWLMNIYHLGTQRLNDVGVTQIYGGDYCTYSEPEKFFSYRREKVTGRMVSLIYIA